MANSPKCGVCRYWQNYHCHNPEKGDTHFGTGYYDWCGLFKGKETTQNGKQEQTAQSAQ